MALRFALTLRRAASSLLHFSSSFSDGFINFSNQNHSFSFLRETENLRFVRCVWVHGEHHQIRNMSHESLERTVREDPSEKDGVKIDENGGDLKPKRKKLKGKRAVIKWLKMFRYQKKKEFERMSAEEKILFKLKKARRKEARLVEALKKIEPADSSEATHDPEILTPEEHFFYLKMGHKSKNYVPIGQRGIFQGVILNMHLHWKKHQTLKVIVKTFTPEEVREIAVELARLSGGIVLDIFEENTIIMYRGRNYSQPPTEIMSPKITLSKKKALDKSKYRSALRAVRKLIPRLEQDLITLEAQFKNEHENKTDIENEKIGGDGDTNVEFSGRRWSGDLHEDDEAMDGSGDPAEYDQVTGSSTASDLSDFFETDSDMETREEEGCSGYLDALDRFPAEDAGAPEEFEENLRRISDDSKMTGSPENLKSSELDEVDRIFLRAGALLKKKRR